MKRNLIAGASVLALAAGGAGVAGAVGGDDESQATGPGAQRARDAALAITKGGRANAVERDSENGATWEVEVAKPDGKTVDVRLDQSFELVVVESDEEGVDARDQR